MPIIDNTHVHEPRSAPYLYDTTTRLLSSVNCEVYTAKTAIRHTQHGDTQAVANWCGTVQDLSTYATRPRFSWRLGLAEALGIINSNVPPFEWFVHPVAAEKFTEISHYGLLSAGQYNEVLYALQTNPDTRQAHITFDTRARPNQHTCITGVTFRVHGDRLDATAYFRSSDVERGLPYDLLQLQALLIAAADKPHPRVPFDPKYRPGNLTVILADAHQYIHVDGTAPYHPAPFPFAFWRHLRDLHPYEAYTHLQATSIKEAQEWPTTR